MSKDELFHQLVERHKDMLWHVCTDYSLDRAWDVHDAYQEVLMALWNALDKMNECEHEKSWAYKVATNTMLMLVRKQRSRCMEPLPPNVDELLSDEAVAPLRVDYACFLRLIDRLAEPDCRIVRMRLDGYGFKEIGKELGMSENTVAQRYGRVIKKIRQRYENEF